MTSRIHNDAKERMMKNQKEAKTLDAMLKRIVSSSDSSHYVLEDRNPQEFEVIENIGILMKIRLKDKLPPCVIRFKVPEKNKIFKLFYSHELREPNEYNNHGFESNVSISYDLLIHSLLQL